jgi:hypothetical protein
MKRTDLLAKPPRAFVASAVEKAITIMRQHGACSLNFLLFDSHFSGRLAGHVSRKGTKSAKTVR